MRHIFGPVRSKILINISEGFKILPIAVGMMECIDLLDDEIAYDHQNLQVKF